MKFVVHNEKGNTRNCYTIPLKMEQANDAYQNEIVYNRNIKCPTVTETTNPQGLAPIYQDNGKTIHSGFTDLKLKNSLEGADKTHYSKYQYNWFMKINSDKSIWDNKGVTFNYSKVEQFNTNFYGEFPSGTRGMLILIDKNGNIKSCYTDYYDNYVYDSMKQINGINYFFEKGITRKNRIIEVAEKIPEMFTIATRNVFYYTSNTYKNHKQLGAAWTYIYLGSSARFDEKTGTNSDYNIYSMYHEFGHNLDGAYKFIHGIYLSDIAETKTLFNKYKNRKLSNGEYRELRDYSFKSNREFIADLVEYTYLSEKNIKLNNDNVKAIGDDEELLKHRINFIDSLYNNYKNKIVQEKLKYKVVDINGKKW